MLGLHYKYICIYVYMYICIYVYMYIYTYKIICLFQNKLFATLSFMPLPVSIIRRLSSNSLMIGWSIVWWRDICTVTARECAFEYPSSKFFTVATLREDFGSFVIKLLLIKALLMFMVSSTLLYYTKNLLLAV